MEKPTKDRIARNAILSLFIFLLPIALMFATFWFTGERPWKEKKHQKRTDTTVNKTNSENNGSND